MRLKKCLFVMISVLLAARSMAQPARYGVDQSGTKATVTLKDGSKVELDDFALYSSERYPRAYYPGKRSSQTQDFAVKVDSFWRVIPPAMLKSLERVPNQDPKLESWATFDVALTSGDHYRALLPLKCKVTWLACDGFEFGGKTSVLGVIGDFAIEVKDLRSVAQVAPGRFEVTDAAGATTTLKELRYQSHSTPPAPYVDTFGFTRIDDGGRRWTAGQPFEVEVGRSKALVKLEQIESLALSDKQPGDLHLRMRSGEEADGHLADQGLLARAFGRTAEGLIWFEELTRVSSVTFGPLSAKK